MSFVNYRNTFVWGYNDIPFSFRKRDSDKFFVRYGRLTREPLPWREECIAIQQIYYSFDDNCLTILLLATQKVSKSIIIQSL